MTELAHTVHVGTCPMCGSVLARDELWVNEAMSTVTLGSAVASLSPMQWRIFTELNTAPRGPRDARRIARVLYGARVDEMSWPKVYDTVHTQVTRLRAKLEPLGMDIVINGKRGWTLALPGGEGARD